MINYTTEKELINSFLKYFNTKINDISKFSKYFEINEDKERFELELIDPSYELDSFVAEDYNLITYNVNEKFDSFDYYGFYLPKTTYDITSLIPNTIKQNATK